MAHFISGQSKFVNRDSMITFRGNIHSYPKTIHE